MDTLTIILIVLGSVIGLIVLLTIIFFLPRGGSETSYIPDTDHIGNMGEEMVNRTLLDVKAIRGGEVYSNLILEDKYKNYTEIDNIYVSIYGVFIIETKAWSGVIKGNKDDKEWTEILGNMDIFHYHENPFIQNARHIKFFNRVIHPRCEVTPVVVFITHKLESIQCRDIVFSSDLERYLLSFEYQAMEQSEYEYIVRRLNAFKSNPPMTHEEYKKLVKEKYKNNKNSTTFQ